MDRWSSTLTDETSKDIGRNWDVMNSKPPFISKSFD